MIAKLLGLPDTPGVMFLVFAGGGMLYFFSIASIAYFLYFRKVKAKVHPTYELDRREMKSAIIPCTTFRCSGGRRVPITQAAVPGIV